MERTVGQVQPNLENNASKINTLITTMDKTLESKQKELVDFKEKHGIKVRNMQKYCNNLYILCSVITMCYYIPLIWNNVNIQCIY